MADVPDAPDELVALLDTTSRRRDMPLEGVRALTKAKARIEADAALIAQQDEMIHECASMPMTAEDHAGMERVGKRLFGEDFTLGPFVPTSEYAALRARLAETERLLRNGLRLLCEGRLSPEEVVFAQDVDAFLAGSATPPEAPELLSPDELQALGVQKWLNAAYSPAPPEAPQQSAAELLPAENIALTVARAQVLRGEAPPPNTAAVLVMALDRLSGQGLWSPDAVAPTEADRP